ncbi:hypothetical protein [Methylocella sp.]|uniref:hypothetical protein n=1 Tax=Methylocella sp. TaxID=1978226 RepID=UPI0035B057AB
MPAADSLEAAIAVVTAEPRLHARWLNTFSYLEYVGFRKIVKSQRAETVDSELLTHALEEGRHALGLKKLAVKLGGEEFEAYAPELLLCGDDAEAYFQNLDAGCDALFAHLPDAQRAKVVYCYVTWLIERRALDVYGRYKAALGTSPLASRIAGLLMEEEKHLADINREIAKADPEFQTRAPELEALEKRLYETFLGQLSAELQASRPRASA